MDLGSVFSVVSEKLTGKQADPESFLAVKLSNTSVVATSWSVENGKIAIGTVSSHDILNKSWDALLSAADQAVSTALGEESDAVRKAVFAVPNDWASDGKLTANHLKDLRALCKELDLTPVGFVVVSEALENFYKETEGAPLSAILIGVDGENSNLSMYRAGKNLGTSPLSIDSSKPDDIALEVEKTLTSTTAVEVLPSRIIIYDGKSDLEKVADKLTAHPWTKKLPFLHFPKIEIAPKELVVKAVAIAGGVQMGGQFSLEEAREGSSDQQTGLSKSEESDKPPVSDQIETSELEEVTPEEAGFATSETSQELTIPVPDTLVTKSPKSAQPQGETVLGQLQEMVSLSKESELLTKESKKFSRSFASARQKAGDMIKKAIHMITSTIQKFVPQIGEVQSSSQGKKKPVYTIGLAFLVLLFLLGVIFYSVPKTTVLVKVSSQIFDKTADVVVVTDNANAVATTSSVLVGSFIDTTEIGTKKGVASGKKLVGDKAKGSVTVYSVSSAKTFPAGTILSAPDGSKFTLDREVNIASGDAITPATITTTAAAFDIGDSYNLPSGTKFTIGNLPSSQYLAKNEAAFSGGNSHQATVVTKDDQDRLFATLSAELSDKARTDLQSKLSPGQNLLPNAVTTTVSQKRFSKDVDSEADTVSLDLTMDFRGVVFSKSDLISLFAQKFSSDIPSGFELSAQSTQGNVTGAKTDRNGNSILTANILGKLLPVVDKKELAQKVSGKSPNSAETIIKSISGVSLVSFETRPRALGFITKLFLPWKKDNISIEIIAD